MESETKTAIITNIISPTRGELYTLVEILKKGFIRSEIVGEIDIRLLHQCFYGSKDFSVELFEFGASDSLWTESASFQINGLIPVHATNNGKLEFGFGCGCDVRHGGQFPSDSDPDNPNWDEYKNNPAINNAVLTVKLGEKSESFLVSDIADNEKKIILGLVKEYLSRKAFMS